MSEREYSFSLRKQKKNAFIAFSYRHSKRASTRASRQKASKHMNETTLTSILIIAVVLIYICYKQCVQQFVSNRDFMLPAAAAIYFGYMVVNGLVGIDSALLVLVGSVLGVLTGLWSGQVVRVWRDNKTEVVFQRGGWSYLLVLIGLLVARMIIYIVLRYTGIAGDFGTNAINDAFIALTVGNYLGRSINVHLRAARFMPQAGYIQR